LDSLLLRRGAFSIRKGWLCYEEDHLPLDITRYVHLTIVALHGHIVQAGHDNFVVHSGAAKEMGQMAAFNIATYVSNTMVCFIDA
jgi:hypothetical protein